MGVDDQYKDERNIDKLAVAIESLKERIDSSSAAPTHLGLTSNDFRELMEIRVRRGVVSSVFRSSLIIILVLGLCIAGGSWLWIGREFRSLAKEIREEEVPKALSREVGERLNLVVEEKAGEVSRNFREEILKIRRSQAEQYLLSDSRPLQIQGLQILRESRDADAVLQIQNFMREKGSLSPLSSELAEANFDYGIQALLSLGTEEAQLVLRQIIADPGYASGIRSDATRAVTILKDRKALPALRTALGDTDRDVRMAAVEAVEQMKARESWPYLVSILSDRRYPKDFPQVIAALRNLGVSQASEVVEAVMRRTSKDPVDFPQYLKTHLEGIAYFREMKIESALSILFEFLMHPNSDLRLQAVAAVRELAESNLGTLEEWKTQDAGWRAAQVAKWREIAIASGKLGPLTHVGDLSAEKEPSLSVGSSSNLSRDSNSVLPSTSLSRVPKPSGTSTLLEGSDGPQED